MHPQVCVAFKERSLETISRYKASMRKENEIRGDAVRGGFSRTS